MYTFQSLLTLEEQYGNRLLEDVLTFLTKEQVDQSDFVLCCHILDFLIGQLLTQPQDSIQSVNSTHIHEEEHSTSVQQQTPNCASGKLPSFTDNMKSSIQTLLSVGYIFVSDQKALVDTSCLLASSIKLLFLGVLVTENASEISDWLKFNITGNLTDKNIKPSASSSEGLGELESKNKDTKYVVEMNNNLVDFIRSSFPWTVWNKYLQACIIHLSTQDNNQNKNIFHLTECAYLTTSTGKLYCHTLAVEQTNLLRQIHKCSTNMDQDLETVSQFFNCVYCDNSWKYDNDSSQVWSLDALLWRIHSRQPGDTGMWSL